MCTKHFQRWEKYGTWKSLKDLFIEDNPPQNGIGQIPLSRGKVAIVDERRYLALIHLNWHITNSGYAARWENGNLILMHRDIHGTPESMNTDHINRNKLDNRDANLRSCTQAENMRNVSRHSDSTAPYKGISLMQGSSKWKAKINVDGSSQHLGTFQTPEDAAVAYDKAAVRHYGKFACINFTRAA